MNAHKLFFSLTHYPPLKPLQEANFPNSWHAYKRLPDTDEWHCNGFQPTVEYKATRQQMSWQSLEPEKNNQTTVSASRRKGPL